MIMKTVVAALVFLLYVSAAVAEDKLGVPVYPGAKYDQARTDLLRKSMSVKGSAYRTGDAMEKVKAFYQKQGLLLLKYGSSSNEIARFKKTGTNVDVVVQNPWKDAKTGADMHDTLILIFKEVEEKGMKAETAI